MFATPPLLFKIAPPLLLPRPKAEFPLNVLFVTLMVADLSASMTITGVGTISGPGFISFEDNGGGLANSGETVQIIVIMINILTAVFTVPRLEQAGLQKLSVVTKLDRGRDAFAPGAL